MSYPMSVCLITVFQYSLATARGRHERFTKSEVSTSLLNHILHALYGLFEWEDDVRKRKNISVCEWLNVTLSQTPCCPHLTPSPNCQSPRDVVVERNRRQSASVSPKASTGKLVKAHKKLANALDYTLASHGDRLLLKREDMYLHMRVSRTGSAYSSGTAGQIEGLS